MIVAKLQGGHSNQLFQYATARCLAERRQAETLMDLDWFGSIAEGDTERSYELAGYRFEQRVLEPGGVVVADEAPGSRLGWRSLRPGRRKPVLRRYRQQGHGFDPDVLALPDDTYLEGWWQDERYFREIRPILIEEIQLREPPSVQDERRLRAMREGISVSLHVRRGDYVTNPAAHVFHGVLAVSYYTAALERIVEVTGDRDVTVFVFSDDTEWCRRELELGYPTEFVDGGNSGAEDMRLMRQCRHHIVANSSFSWWGAWLSNHPAKVVVAPEKWFADPEANAATEVVPQSWLRI